MKIISNIIAVFFISVSLAIADTPPSLSNLTGCTLSNNPSSLDTDCVDIPGPDITVPALLSWQTSLFNGRYARISMPTGQPNPSIVQMYPNYAKNPVWNADGSLLMTLATSGYFHLLDGNTYQYVKKLDNSEGMYYSGQDPEPRWDVNDADKYYYVYQMQFRAYSVANSLSTTIKTFSSSETGCGAYTCTNIHNGDEGNQDDGNRYWAWYAQDSGYNQRSIFVYDQTTNTVVASKNYLANGICGAISCPSTANWVSMSHSGNHVVIQWNATSSDGVMTERGKGTEVFDRDLNYIAKVSEKSNHADLAQLADGTDVYVGSSRLNLTNAYKAVRAVSLDTGEILKSCMLPVQRYQHISGRSTSEDVRGWVLYSTYDQTGGGAGVGIFASEVFALNMDTCEVRRIAHTQSWWSSSEYRSEPHAVVNWDFSKIAWGSNWRDQSGYVQTYVAELSSPTQQPQNGQKYRFILSQ